MAHQKHIVTEEDAGIRLDKWFKRNRPDYSHALLQKFLRKKDIKVNGKRSEANYRVQEGDVIFAMDIVQQERKAKPKSDKPITQDIVEDFKSWIIFENNDYLAINKPQGLASQGGSGITLSVDSIIREISPRYKLVHRLDKDTSGVLVIAKKTTAATKFGEALQAGEVNKTYLALVTGLPKPKSGYIDLPLLKKGKIEKMGVDEKGKKALTEYQVIENMGGKLSLLELKPITGRTHQLRAHCAAIGHPIIGDGKYGGQDAFLEGFRKKLYLHAKHIHVPSLEIEAEATVPSYFRNIV